VPGDATILGLDASPELIAVARQRARDGTGEEPAMRFSVQSVLEPFRWPGGRRVEADEIGLVNSSGAVGCHFEPAATAHLAVEVKRVLRSGGLALIDSGAGGTSSAQVVRIFTRLGFEVLGRARSCVFDRYWQYCFRAP
jgi:SAM-dependent methyltransferase